MQADPIRFYGGVNFYLYVKNNSINLIDPSGLFKINFGAGADMPTGPAPVSFGYNMQSQLNTNLKFEGNGGQFQRNLGDWGGANVSLGVNFSDGNNGNTFNFGLGKYLGFSVTIEKDTDYEWYDPRRYSITDIDFNLGLGLALPISLTQKVECPNK